MWRMSRLHCPERQGQAPLNTKALLRVRSTCQWPAVSVVTSHCTRPGPWANTGKLRPPRLARARTENRTVALPFPAGWADTTRNVVTVIFGPPPLRNDRTHGR